MIHLIDYYAFTIPLERAWEEHMFHLNRDYVIDRYYKCLPPGTELSWNYEDWCVEKGRGFYFWRLRDSSSDVALSFGGVNPHIFVELAGQACANLDSMNLLLPLIQTTCENATRIDFAIDIETDVIPPDFVAKRGDTPFSASGNITSGRGVTEYVGGRTSERMARVYRYFPPHPRAIYLRVEAEYKRSAAKAAAALLKYKPLTDVSLSAHASFRWQHPVWEPESQTGERLTYRHGGRNEAGSVHWLYSTVISAVQKASNNGLIDFEEWLETLRKGLK
jgi:DNA relaxase NicK